MKKRRIVTPSPAKKKPVDWNKLWLGVKSIYEAAGMDRQKAVLENFRDQKEEICRSMNVISEADLARIQRQVSEQMDKVKGTSK